MHIKGSWTERGASDYATNSDSPKTVAAPAEHDGWHIQTNYDARHLARPTTCRSESAADCGYASELADCR